MALFDNPYERMIGQKAVIIRKMHEMEVRFTKLAKEIETLKSGSRRYKHIDMVLISLTNEYASMDKQLQYVDTLIHHYEQLNMRSS